MYKNVTGQKWRVFAYTASTGVALTGDAANISAKISKDHGTAAATNDVAPTEIEDGFYDFDLTQAETNAHVLHLLPESSTSGIVVVGVPGTFVTQPQYMSDLGIASDGDLTKVNALDGHTVQTGDSYAVVNNVTYGNSALETLVDELESRLTASRAGYLDNLNGHTPQTGDSYAELISGVYGLAVIEGLVDDLEGRLTAARATALDELTAANIPADIDALLARLTAARAGYIDNLLNHVAQSGDSFGIVNNVTFGNSALETLVDELESRLTLTRAGYLDNLNGHTPQTGDGYAELVSGTYGLSVIEALVDTLEARVPAALVGGRMDVSLSAVENDTSVATALRRTLGTVEVITIGVGSTTTNIVSDLSVPQNDHFNSRDLLFVTGALAKLRTDITDSDAVTDDLTVTAVHTAPSSGDIAVIV